MQSQGPDYNSNIQINNSQSLRPGLYDQRATNEFTECQYESHHAVISDNDHSFDLFTKPDEVGFGINQTS